MWEHRRLATLWASTACYRDSFLHLWPYYAHSESHNVDATTTPFLPAAFLLMCKLEDVKTRPVHLRGYTFRHFSCIAFTEKALLCM
jgi:hypothetical protein